MATRNKTKFKNNWFTKLKKPKGVSEAYNGSYLTGDLGGVKVENKSLKKYYGKEFMPPKIES
jgi:hypothetical protein|tara:strand:- start:411 stop:596 length:186 start_codon:yes stop_codon:yes gene_type:complete